MTDIGKTSFASTAAAVTIGPEIMVGQSKTTSTITDQTPLDNADRDGREIPEERTVTRKKVPRKVDIRLCTIAGLLCSLNLLDSGILS